MDNSPLPQQPTIIDGSNKYRNNSSMVYNNGALAGENSTASTGMSGNSGISNGATISLASNQKHKQRYVMSPTKIKKGDHDGMGMYGSGGEDQVRLMGSPEKFKIKDKMAIVSFLQGFEYLTEDDLEILAGYEEEQARRQQTQLERLFPTKDTIETLGKCFEC